MLVLGVVTARGGSKGVPRKNIRPLAGKPLLAYTADSALAATTLTRVVLSTDDEEVAACGREHGLEVPFMRPAELAHDTTPMLPVLIHVMGELERSGERYDALCLLQPTDPLRRAEDIDGCVHLLEATGADSVITVQIVPHEYNPHWVYVRDGEYMRLSTGEAEPIPRRQELPPAYHRSGSVYLVRRDVLMERGSLYGDRVVGYVLPAGRAANIDTWGDWERAERTILAAREASA
jgi:CMP-N-acetylneuraminic acid synthetase